MLQMQSFGKGNLSEEKDETVSVPPVSTDSGINTPVRSPQPERFLKVSGMKCCRHAQPVLLIQLTEMFNRFSRISNESGSEAKPSQFFPPPVTGSEPPKPPTIGDSITILDLKRIIRQSYTVYKGAGLPV